MRASVTEVANREWFKDLLEYLENQQLLHMMDDPSSIFNADEAGIKTLMKSRLVLAPSRKMKKNQLPCFAIMQQVGWQFRRWSFFLTKELALSLPKGWAIEQSDPGWMTTAVFFEYIANIFYPWLVWTTITWDYVLALYRSKKYPGVVKDCDRGRRIRN